MKFIKRSNNWIVRYTIGEVMRRLGPQRRGKPTFWGHNDCMRRYLKNRFYYIKTAKRGWKKRNHHFNLNRRRLNYLILLILMQNTADLELDVLVQYAIDSRLEELIPNNIRNYFILILASLIQNTINSESEILPQSVTEARNSNPLENIGSELNSCVHDGIFEINHSSVNDDNTESEILPQSVTEARNSNPLENIGSELNSCVHDGIFEINHSSVNDDNSKSEILPQSITEARNSNLENTHRI